MPILKCTCNSPQQDKLHGLGRRVFNATAKKDPRQYRCTVCCSVKTKDNSAIDAKKTKKK
jgi:hypothetical protein